MTTEHDTKGPLSERLDEFVLDYRKPGHVARLKDEIRALEADNAKLAAQQEHDTKAIRENQDELSRLYAKQNELFNDNARLAGEVERVHGYISNVWKAIGVDTYEAAQGKTVDEIVLEIRKESDRRLGEIIDLRARLAAVESKRDLLIGKISVIASERDFAITKLRAAEARVKELEAFINDPQTKVLKLTHQWDRESGKWIDPDTQEGAE